LQPKPSSKFNQQAIKEVALKYDKRSHFREGSPTFYRAAIRYGWLDEICSHMVTRKQWTFNAVKREARKYKTRSEFRNSAGSAYNKALRESWLDELSKHMEPVRNTAYTKEEITQEAAKYKYRSDFKASANGHYQRARRQGWLDDVCKHMSVRTDGGSHCVYSIVNERLRKVYIGITRQNLNKRISDHKSKKNRTFSRLIVGEPDTEIKQLSDYIYSAADVKEFAERKFIKDYLNLGYEVLNSEKAIGTIGYKEAIWTKSALQKEAAKYKSRKEFRARNSSAYATATRRSDFAEITSHMSYKRHSWNKEKIAKISLQYKTRASFKQASPSAYLHARLNGFLDEVCRHMKPVNKTWDKGLVLKEAKKFKSRDRFRLKASGAYKWAVRHGCLDEVCRHM
jgi:hypothetical protein